MCESRKVLIQYVYVMNGGTLGKERERERERDRQREREREDILILVSSGERRRRRRRRRGLATTYLAHTMSSCALMRRGRRMSCHVAKVFFWFFFRFIHLLHGAVN